MNDETWITTEGAVQISGYHINYLRQLIKDGRIKGRKFGPVWQVDRSSLQEYLNNAVKTGDKRFGSKK